MSEIIKEFKKGDLLYLNNEGKACWGFPEGYPHKEEGITIEWDGNTEGLEHVGQYYLVSDVIISNDECKRGIAYDNYGVAYQMALAWDNWVAANAVTDDFCFMEAVVVVRRAGITIPIMDITFNTPGIYFMKNTIYITKFTTEALTPIFPDFLPNATTTTPGTVKQMSYLPNATGDAPTAENFNQLLRELKNAGLMK